MQIIKKKITDPVQLACRRSPLAKEKWYGYAFTLPMFIGYTLFVLLPIIATIFISLTDWSLLKDPMYVGTKNYLTMFANDPVFLKTAVNSLYFVALFLPGNLILTLPLAAMLKKNLPGIGIFRTAVFTPVVTTIVAWCLVWKYLLQTDNGLINIVLRMLGISGPQWLYNTSLAIPVVVLVTLTRSLGLNMIIFINAMQEVPDMYYEAATIDGASQLQQFRKITLPLIAPSIFLVAIITIIGALKVFGQVYITTGGGPGDSSHVFVYYIYLQAFRYYKFGYASAISLLLFLIILILTLIQWRARKRWVHHEM